MRQAPCSTCRGTGFFIKTSHPSEMPGMPPFLKELIEAAGIHEVTGFDLNRSCICCLGLGGHYLPCVT